MKNSACLMRDKLIEARRKNKITLKEITNKLCKIEMPMWLQSEILQMTNYKKYERITCPIEQAMEAAVNYHILNEIMRENTLLNNKAN